MITQSTTVPDPNKSGGFTVLVQSDYGGEFGRVKILSYVGDRKDMSEQPASLLGYSFLAQVTTGREWMALAEARNSEGQPCGLRIKLDRFSRESKHKTLLRDLKELVY